MLWHSVGCIADWNGANAVTVQSMTSTMMCNTVLMAVCFLWSKICFRLVEIHWLCFYLDQTTVCLGQFVTLCCTDRCQVLHASGWTRHEIKGTPVLTCHETAYSALYASLPVLSTINTSNGFSTCSSRFSSRLTGHTVLLADPPSCQFTNLFCFPHQLACFAVWK